MRYEKALKVEVAHTVDNPAEFELNLAFGHIEQVYILHPPGCVGLVHVQVFYQTRQILPTTPGASFVGAGAPIIFPARIEIFEPPFAVLLRGWRTGGTHDHTVQIGLTVLPPVILVPTIVHPPPLPVGL